MAELFPDKFTPIESTVVGDAASVILALQSNSMSVGQLFVELRRTSPILTFEDFALSLTLLYGAGILEYDDLLLRIS